MYDFREIWREELSKEKNPASVTATATGRAAVSAMQRAFELGRQDYAQDLERGLHKAMSDHEADAADRRAQEASYRETLATP